MIKNSKKILESKKINVIRGVVSGSSKYLILKEYLYSVVGGSFTKFFYIAGNGSQDFKSIKMKSSKSRCEAGMFIEIRYNPYTIKRIDNILYDVNFIYENEGLTYIKECENLLLELQEELDNTDPENQEEIDDLNEKIGLAEIFIEESKIELSKLPIYIDYPIKSKTDILDTIVEFSSVFVLISLTLLLLSGMEIITIVSIDIAFVMGMTGFIVMMAALALSFFLDFFIK